MTNEMLIDWINDEVKKRGWSFRELSRRAGISSPTISQVMNNQANPGLNFCKGIAQAFSIRLEDVLRKANILPPEPEEVTEEEEVVRLLRELPPRERQETLEYLRFRYQRREGPSYTEPHKTLPTPAIGDQQVTIQNLMGMLATRSYSDELELDEDAQEALAKLLIDLAELAKKLDQQGTSTTDNEATQS